MRYPSTTSELDATMIKWLTGSIDKDGKKKRREEQKAAQMRIEQSLYQLMTQTATYLMLFLGVCGAEMNQSNILKLKMIVSLN